MCEELREEATSVIPVLEAPHQKPEWHVVGWCLGAQWLHRHSLGRLSVWLSDLHSSVEKNKTQGLNSAGQTLNPCTSQAGSLCPWLGQCWPRHSSDCSCPLSRQHPYCEKLGKLAVNTRWDPMAIKNPSWLFRTYWSHTNSSHTIKKDY